MPFFHKLNIQEWVPEQIKTRLLEWKMRLDLLQYISRGSPPLTVSPENDPLDIYVPREGPDGLASDISPRDLLPRVMEIEDDGHTIKLARALIIAQDNTRHFADRGWVRIHNDKQWLRIHHMLLHGVEGQPGQWVRSAGFKEAWGEIPVVE